MRGRLGSLGPGGGAMSTPGEVAAAKEHGGRRGLRIRGSKDRKEVR